MGSSLGFPSRSDFAFINNSRRRTLILITFIIFCFAVISTFRLKSASEHMRVQNGASKDADEKPVHYPDWVFTQAADAHMTPKAYLDMVFNVKDDNYKLKKGDPGWAPDDYVEPPPSQPALAKIVDMSISEALEPVVLSQIIKKNVAAIVETRNLSNLVPLLLHYAAVLGPAWPIVLFTSQDAMIDSAAFRRSLSRKQIYIQTIPADTAFETHFDVSKFFTKPWFWETLAPAENVLLFQADSIICANAKQKADDFTMFDYVGSPIPEENGQGYNGGFSLRNREMFLQIVKDNDFIAEVGEDPLPYNLLQFEDQWFFSKLKALTKANGEPAANLPDFTTARTFGVQGVFYEFPLGYHQPYRWQASNITRVTTWCPEISLCRTEELACKPPLC